MMGEIILGHASIKLQNEKKEPTQISGLEYVVD